jgi:hypothetical protein
MIVILTQNQILSPEAICQSCLLADQGGHPRWHHGQLCCGHPLVDQPEAHTHHYRCQMGFRIAEVDAESR